MSISDPFPIMNSLFLLYEENSITLNDVHHAHMILFLSEIRIKNICLFLILFLSLVQ